MTDSNDSAMQLTRRDALKNAIVLVGGGIAASRLGLLSRAMAAEPFEPRFLSGERFSLVERAVDIIIPPTDTPGAAAAGVHRFIDTMLADWANEDSRDLLVRAIDDIDASARETHGLSFLELGEDRQAALLETIDRESYGGADSRAPFVMLKRLTILGYYTSEIGASVELRFDPVPGASPGCVPLDDIGRAWYKHWGL